MSKTRDIADSAEVINYLDTVTSNVQDQIDTKASATNGTFTGTVTADGLSLGDDAIASFGAGNDLSIYHNGTQSIIEDQGTGGLLIKASANLQLRSSTDEVYINCVQDAQVSLKYNNNTKLDTTSTGIDVTGTITADGLSLGDDAIASFGTGDDLQIYHDSATGQTIITETGSGNLRLQASQLVLQNAGGTKNYFIGLDSGASILYHDNNAKISTTSTGADITGTVTATAFEGDGSGLTGIDSLPTQTANGGKYLTTDGTNASWATLTTDPTKATLSKTFLENESYQLTLSEPITSGCPVVSVTKEIPQTNQTNNTWDVNSSSNNYIREDSAYDTTLSWAGGGVTDISTATFVDSFSVASQDSTPRGLSFSPDGTNMYVVGRANTTVYQYALSTGFDVSSATYSGNNYNVSAQQTIPNGVAISPDGSKMFIVGSAADAVHQYGLSTPFNVSTASLSATFSTATQDSALTEITFNNDGTKMYVIGEAGDDVNEYVLTTAFDVSTASFFQNFSVLSQDATATGLAFNSNGTKMYVAGPTGDAINEYSLSSAFDISTSSFVQALSVGSQDTYVWGIAFNSDSSKMFVLGMTDNDVNEYQLDLPLLELGVGSFTEADVGKTVEASSGTFILTGADGSYSQIIAPTSYDQVASGDWNMYSLVYDSGEDTLKVSGGDVGSTIINSFSIGANTSDYMYRYALAGHSSNAITISCWLNVNALATTNQAWCFTGGASENDGLHLVYGTATGQAILYDGGNSTILDVAAITAGEWNHIAISAVSGTQEVYFNGQFAGTANRTFTPITGPWDLLIGQEPDSHTLGSAWGGFSATQSLNGHIARMRIFDRTITAPEALLLYRDNTISPIDDIFGDGSIVATYLLESNGEDLGPLGLDLTQSGGSFVANFPAISSRVFASGYSPAITAFSINTQNWNDINTMTVDDIPGDGSISYALSNDNRTTWSVVDNAGTRNIVRNNVGTWQYNSNATYASETWTNATTNTELAALAEAMEVSTNDIAGINNATYDSISFSTASQDVTPTGMIFADNGTKLYTTGSANDSVYEYSLSTAYNLSTLSYVRSFSVGSQDSSPHSVGFNLNGTKMFVLGNLNRAIYQYSLSTPWNISTASYDSVSLSSGYSITQCFRFKDDGSKLYILGDGFVYQYNLSTAFAISTASYESKSFNFTPQSTNATNVSGFEFSLDGSKIYMVERGNDRIHQYSLSTPWDVSTISYDSAFLSVASEDVSPYELLFNSNETKMYMIGLGSDAIFQYSFSTVSLPNQMDKTQLEAVTDANQITLGDSLDLAIILNIETGVNLPSSDGVSINYDGNVLNKGAILGTDYDFDFPASDKVNITALNANNYKVRIV